MTLIKVKNYKELSKKTFDILTKEIKKNPNLVIGFATGRTSLGLYGNLVRAYRKNKIDFSRIKSFNLDEYWPIKKSDTRSMDYHMQKNLFSKINIKKSNTNLLDGETKSPTKEAADYELKIKKNPVDIQILGVGINGHIGYNEPNSNFNSKTRLINLSKITIKNKFGNGKKVPKKALTMGIKTILKAKKIILMASGNKKAEAIKHLIEDESNKNWPVTALKKHKNIIIIADEKALSKL